MCNKLQTEVEKVLPFGSYKQNDPDSFPCPTLKNLANLDLFWIRVSNVNRQNLELEEEKRKLMAENERLQELIRIYCRQDKYSKSVATLRLCPRKTVAKVVRQEAAHLAAVGYINPFGVEK